MSTPKRSFLEKVRALFQRRRQRQDRRGLVPTLRLEQLEPRWTMSGLVDAPHINSIAKFVASMHGSQVAAHVATASVSPTATAAVTSASTPAAPTAVVLAAASDTGSSSTDGITNLTTGLQFNVSGVTSGATVNLYDGSNTTPIGTATASGTSVAILDNGTLSTGVHSITAVQVVGGVASAASSVDTVTVVSTGPTFTSTAPTQASTSTTAGTSYPLTYQAVATSPVAVTYSLTNGAPTGATINANTGLLSWTPTSAQVGTQTFGIVATDAAGNATTQNLSIVVTANPTFQIRLGVTDLSGNPITSLAVGQRFLLNEYVTDLRAGLPSDSPPPASTGPYAAYTTVAYNQNVVAPVLPFSISGTGSATTVTVNTTTAHHFTVGQSVTIAGVVADSLDAGVTGVLTGINGTFTIASVPTATSFTFTSPTAAISGELTGSTTAAAMPDYVLAGGTAQLAAVTNSTVTTNGSVVTVTTSAAHNFVVGESVTVAGVKGTGISGINGTFVITSVPTSTTFTYASSGSTATSVTAAGSSTPSANLVNTINPGGSSEDTPNSNTWSNLGNATTTPGVINNLGDFLQVSTPLGPGEFLFTSVQMTATAAGTVSFTAQPASGVQAGNLITGGSTTPIDTKLTVYQSTGATVQSLQAVNDSFTIDGNTTNNNFNVLANDVVPTGFNTPTVTAVGTSAHGGTVAIATNGTGVTYTPANGYVGSDTFTYTATSGTSTSTATVTVNVLTPVKATNDSNSTDSSLLVAKGTANNVLNLLGNDVGTGIKITSVTTPSNGGTVTIGANGANVSYTPAASYPTGSTSAVETFTYTITDSAGVTSTATATVTVSPNIHQPTAINQTYNVNESSTSNNFTVLTGDSLATGVTGTLTVTAVGTPSHGTVTIASGGGSVNYTPNALYVGTDTFTYTVGDGNGNAATATVTVTVKEVTMNPTAVADTYSIVKNSSTQTFNVLSNDTFVHDVSKTLTVTAVSAGSAGGTIAVAPNGTGVQYTPKANYTGTETFTYTISDGQGGTATGNVTVTITNFVGSSLSGTVLLGQNQPVVGVTVSLVGTDTSSNPVSKTTTTDASGNYTFTNLAPGTYTVSQASLPFLKSSTSVSGTQTATVTGNGLSVTLPDATTDSGNNFVSPGRQTQYVDLRDFIASRNHNYVTAAVNPTSGLVWSTPSTAWSAGSSGTTYLITAITYSASSSQYTLTATKSVPSATSGGSPTTSTVTATVSATDSTKVVSYGTDSSGNQLIKLLGPASNLGFQ